MSWILHEGDCRDSLGHYEGQVDLVVTSPPYGNLRDYGGDGFDWRSVIDALVPVLAPGGVIVWNVGAPVVDGDESSDPHEQVLRFKQRGLVLHDTIIALKSGSGGKTWPRRHSREWEACYVFARHRPRTVAMIIDRRTSTAGARRSESAHRDPGGDLRRTTIHVTPTVVPRSNVWGPYRIGNLDHGDTKHPAVMSAALVRDHIRTWSESGDLVLDPMAGSGTTLRAAVDLGRRAVGMEIHPPYCDIIRARMAQAVLLSS